MKRLLVFSVLLSVCVSTIFGAKPTVYDKKVPMEQSSTLILVTCSVLMFDGKSMGFNKGWQAHNGFPKEVIIPAGTHTLSMYAEYIGAGRISQVTYEPFTHEFLPGRIYAIQKNSITADKGVRMRDVTELFEEFVSNSGGSDASPIEGTWEFDKQQLIFSGDQFITLNKGKNNTRGFFYIEDNTVYLPHILYYSGKKWKIYPLNMTGTAIFDGITLSSPNGKQVFRKVE